MDLTTEQGYLERYPISNQFGHPATLPRPWGIGHQLLQQAIAAGHDVTAMARNPRRLPGTLPAGVREVMAELAAPDPSVLESG